MWSKIIWCRSAHPVLVHNYIYFVDWGSITMQQTARYKGTIHYASFRFCSSWHNSLTVLKSALHWPASSVAHIQLAESCKAASSSIAVVDVNHVHHIQLVLSSLISRICQSYTVADCYRFLYKSLLCWLVTGRLAVQNLLRWWAGQQSNVHTGIGCL